MLNPKAKRGEVWLVRFPFSDLTSAKRRPALVLAVHGEDVVVVGIFSRVPQGSLRKTWVYLDASHPGFVRSGLKKASVLKAEKISDLRPCKRDVTISMETGGVQWLYDIS